MTRAFFLQETDDTSESPCRARLLFTGLCCLPAAHASSRRGESGLCLRAAERLCCSEAPAEGNACFRRRLLRAPVTLPDRDATPEPPAPLNNGASTIRECEARQRLSSRDQRCYNAIR